MADIETPDYSLLDGAGAALTMFYPRTDLYPPTNGASDHFFEAEAGVRLGARLYGVDPLWPTLLYFHGNGEIASDYDDISALYNDRRLNLLVVDFRGYGASTGHPTAATLVSDAHPVVQGFHGLLDGLGYSKVRYLMGRSLGAHPALEAAANAGAGFAGLIIESGASNLRRSLDRYGLLETELGGRLAKAHEAKLASIVLPTVIIHGEHDELVPLETAHQLFDLLALAERKLVTIPEAGHNDLLWAGERLYFDSIEELVTATRDTTRGDAR